MSDERRRVDFERLNDFLDGELSSSEAAAFEEDLRTDVATKNRVAALRGMANWFRETRPRAPSYLAERVEQAMRAADPGARPAPKEPQVVPLPAWRRAPLWAGAALAAAAVLAILLLPNMLERREAGRSTFEDPASAAQTQASETGAGTVRYQFSFRAPRANEVCLAGDFNNWKVCDAQLTRVEEDLWSISLDLPRGRHEYMFVVDGQWRTDPEAALHADDGFGNKNAVLTL
jgi:hypothetical protein